jgi:hypothetical protein
LNSKFFSQFIYSYFIQVKHPQVFHF